jgi:hypothetical protein
MIIKKFGTNDLYANMFCHCFRSSRSDGEDRVPAEGLGQHVPLTQRRQGQHQGTVQVHYSPGHVMHGSIVNSLF